jgi:hypothetical protein
MATYTKFEVFTEDLCEGVHNMDAAGNTLKVFLTDTAPNAATNTVRANLTAGEPATANGYTVGGEDAQNSTSRTGGVTSVVGVDITWNATGAVGPFRYAVLYNDTPASPLDPLIAYWDYGSSISLANGESFTVDFGTEIFTLT